MYVDVGYNPGVRNHQLRRLAGWQCPLSPPRATPRTPAAPAQLLRVRTCTHVILQRFLRDYDDAAFMETARLIASISAMSAVRQYLLPGGHSGRLARCRGSLHISYRNLDADLKARCRFLACNRGLRTSQSRQMRLRRREKRRRLGSEAVGLLKTRSG